MPVNRTCPHCGETKPFFVGEPERACDDCRSKFFATPTSWWDDHMERLERQREARKTRKANRELVRRNQGKLL